MRAPPFWVVSANRVFSVAGPFAFVLISAWCRPLVRTECGGRIVHQEIELKFAISQVVAIELLLGTDLLGARKRQMKQVQFDAIYFDTPRYRLRRLGADFRIKRTEDRYMQTVKLLSTGGGSAGGAVLSREEHQKEVSGFVPDLPAAREALSELSRQLGANDLSPLFSTAGTRALFDVKWRDSRIAVSVDDGRYVGLRGQTRQLPMHELELELLSGKVDSLLDLAERLNDRFDIRQTLFSKADFGYHLVSPAYRLRPVKWKRHGRGVELHTLKAQLGRALSHFLMNDPLLLHDRLSAVHQSRVAIRRARAVLRAHKRQIDYLERKGLNGELKWLQERLGEARDWQVFDTEVLPRLILSPEIAEEIQIHTRRQIRRKLNEAMEHFGSRRARRLILKMQRWTADLEDEPRNDRKARSRTFRKDVENLLAIRRFPPMSRPNDIHAIRILGKKLRYVFEMSPELDTEEMRATHKALKDLQDILGRYNDLAKGLELFASAQSNVVSTRALGALRNAVEKQQEKAYARMKPRYTRLRRLTRKMLAEMDG